MVTLLLVVLTVVDSEFTVVDIDTMDVDMDDVVVEVFVERLLNAVDIELSVVDVLVEREFKPVDNELAAVDILDDAPVTAVDMELTDVDIEAKLLESDVDTVLIDAESDEEKVKNCPPFTASVLDAAMHPFARLVSKPLLNVTVEALNITEFGALILIFPSAPIVMYSEDPLSDPL